MIVKWVTTVVYQIMYLYIQIQIIQSTLFRQKMAKTRSQNTLTWPQDAANGRKCKPVAVNG